MSARKGYWFRPKQYGYGASPANWKGWLATGLYIAIIAGLTWQFIVGPVRAAAALSVQDTLLGWGMLIAATLGFVWLCWRKTDGDWRWRWGSDA